MGEAKFNLYNRLQRRNEIHCDPEYVIC